MSKRLKFVTIAGCVAVLLGALALRYGFLVFPFFAAQADGIKHAGTWEDDPQNWYRAFGTAPPAGIKVIHSKYWRSSHFTVEYMYYFEVAAPSEWHEAFLRKRGLVPVSASDARSFRTTYSSTDIPDWFAPDPVKLYDVWDRPGYHGAAWINQTNGNLFFYNFQL